MLGFTRQYRLLTLLLLCLSVIFFLVKPFVKQMIKRNYIFLFTYILCSSIFLNVLFIASLHSFDHFIVYVGFRVLFIFGIVLAIYLLVKAIGLTVKRLPIKK